MHKHKQTNSSTSNPSHKQIDVKYGQPRRKKNQIEILCKQKKKGTGKIKSKSHDSKTVLITFLGNNIILREHSEHSLNY